MLTVGTPYRKPSIHGPRSASGRRAIIRGVSGRSTRRLSEDEYLREIERLAKDLVTEAIHEDSFEVYLDQGPKTPLQRAITRLARSLRGVHYRGDGCIPDEQPKVSTRPQQDERE